MLPIILTLLLIAPSVSSLSPAQSLAAELHLTTSTSIPYPAATQGASDATSFIEQHWGGHVENEQSIAFVNDPFPKSPAPDGSGSTKLGPVLQVTYPAHSYSLLGSGGTQIYSPWGSSFQTMLLSYEVAFDSGFNWIKGGKLPGLRGGMNPGCSGGREADGSNCFTSRTMWRRDGAGEGMLFF
jgi:hypothetical protein